MTKQLTNQEAYDLGLNGIRSQGYRRSLRRERGSTAYQCVYRAPSGDKCIAGHCIPDGQYRKRMEGEGIWNLIIDGEIPALRGVSPDLLAEMQNAHDHHLAEGPAAFEERMHQIATNYGATYTPPEMVEGHIVTPWFDAEVVPARPGVYQVRNCLGDIGACRHESGLWSINLIHSLPTDPLHAELPCEFVNPGGKWRGIYSNREQQ